MTVQLEIDGQMVNAPTGASVFDCAEQVGVRVPTSCHKNGKCRECLVEVADGLDLLSDRTAEESHLADAFRLSCRATIVEHSGIIRCRTMQRGEMRITDAGSGITRPQRLDPAVVRVDGVVLLDGEPIDSFTGPIHGIAVDVGTTTVVMRLVDLEDGRIVASHAFENPQRFGGSDVMARIHYDTLHPGRLLQRTLLGYMAHSIEDFGVDPLSIFEVVVAGNSTMRDLVFGLNVESIGQRPYRSIVEHEYATGKRETTCVTADARKMRLPIHPKARVWGLPLVSGHVGADAAACLLAVGMPTEDRLVVLMDIGTNTELIVGSRNRLFAASCPAGPAFEGGVVSCGMAGLEGAIEAVRIDGKQIEYDVIGDVEPKGICGSGLVDLLSELKRTRRMNDLGRFVDESEKFPVDAAGGIALSEADISELAQAKGANVAGIRIVLDHAGIDLDAIDVFYLAGGFAKHLDVAAARRIGLIPDLPDERIRSIGNAAIEGATIALLSKSSRDELEQLVQRIEHVELETHEHFFDYFVDGCQFMRVRDDQDGANND